MPPAVVMPPGVKEYRVSVVVIPCMVVVHMVAAAQGKSSKGRYDKEFRLVHDNGQTGKIPACSLT